MPSASGQPGEKAKESGRGGMRISVTWPSSGVEGRKQSLEAPHDLSGHSAHLPGLQERQWEPNALGPYYSPETERGIPTSELALSRP